MIDDIVKLVKEAGFSIMQFYGKKQELKVETKYDNSPVTLADLTSNSIICSGLQRLTPDIPVLSEESIFNYVNHSDIKTFWLVDPLDGTKDFLYNYDEFTINIAFIRNSIPIIGVIYVPVFDNLYFAVNGEAWKMLSDGTQYRIYSKWSSCPLIVVSRFHLDIKKFNRYLMKFTDFHVLCVGSALKFCMLAEGYAQLYPRFSFTKIWDVAAGDAIVTASGARVTDWDGNILSYTLSKSFLNPGFQVSCCN